MKRLPARHKFPGGFVLYINVVPLGTTVRGITLPPDCEAYFDTIDLSSGQVLINSDLTPRQRWRALAHEMQHACLDAAHQIEKEVAP
jgi:hypothetical protein